jgi:hypothetical protein
MNKVEEDGDPADRLHVDLGHGLKRKGGTEIFAEWHTPKGSVPGPSAKLWPRAV